MTRLRVHRLPVLIIAAALMIAGLPSAQAAPAAIHHEETTIGTSLQGRPITAVHRWMDGATDRVLVLGQMHGNEKAGLDIARRLETAPLPANTNLWVIATMNPDGNAAGTR